MAAVHKVTAPCVVVPDESGSRREFYVDAILPNGLDAEHVAGLVEQGMVELVELPDPEADAEATETTEKAAKAPTVAELLEDVDGDVEKAAELLAAEEASDKPRSGLVKALRKIVDSAGQGS